MNNELKYYTPELWEFCEGFDVEVKHLKGSWQSWSINTKKGDIEWLLDVYYPERVRVKYLDRQDIESLGFALSHDFDEICLFQQIKPYKLIHFYYNKIDEKFSITLNRECCYKGEIRNKFHLAQILKDIA